jgi:hypothetical protein
MRVIAASFWLPRATRDDRLASRASTIARRTMTARERRPSSSRAETRSFDVSSATS